MWCSSSCQDTLIPKARIAAPFFVCGLVRDLEIWAFYHTPNAFFPFLSLYWCFDQKYVVKYVKETCGNVHSTPKETCDNATLLSSKNQLKNVTYAKSILKTQVINFSAPFPMVKDSRGMEHRVRGCRCCPSAMIFQFLVTRAPPWVSAAHDDPSGDGRRVWWQLTCQKGAREASWKVAVNHCDLCSNCGCRFQSGASNVHTKVETSG